MLYFLGVWQCILSSVRQNWLRDSVVVALSAHSVLRLEPLQPLHFILGEFWESLCFVAEFFHFI